MTVKQFFKSTAFKCIAVLLAILLVCGILLTVCNSLFYVSAEEKLQRAISKIYGETVTYETEVADKDILVTSAQVLEVYDITTEEHKNDYLLKVKGNGGYGGGSVTCWVRVEAAAGGSTVKKITIDSNVGQSYITKISSGALGNLVNKQKNDGFTSFDTDGIKTGASFSMNAISNAANAALTYVNAKLGVFSKYYGYAYNDYLDDTTDIEVNGTTVEYSIVTKGGIQGKFNITIHVAPDADVNKITKYEITQNGSSPTFPGNDTDYATEMSPQALDLNGKTLEDIQGYLADERKEEDGGVLHTGATISNSHCYYAAAFALANYDRALSENSQGGAAQ
ncbi:MAG: hypothetical protein NC033_05425 [Clostridiales bacterium]|nr:hypothetical protein [Clostridiales bacterium]